MKLRLNKQFFKRKHHREQQAGSSFANFSSRIQLGLTIFLAMFAAPTLIVSTFILKDILLFIANCSLTVAFLVNFGYRIWMQEISVAEIVLTLIALAAITALIVYLSPALAAASPLVILIFTNQLVASINAFFLFKNVFIPPIKKGLEYVAQYLGFDITSELNQAPKLDLEQDADIIYSLQERYGIESAETCQNHFNSVLKILQKYHNKYNDSTLGSIENAEKIKKIEGYISAILNEGKAFGALDFIRQKKLFKEKKLKRYQHALDTLKKDGDKSISNQAVINKYVREEKTHFFDISYTLFGKSEQALQTRGTELLEEEIHIQEQKIASLSAALK